MSTLTGVVHTELPEARAEEFDLAEVYTRLERQEVPGFVLRNAGLVLQRALKTTGLLDLLTLKGWTTDGNSAVEFDHSVATPGRDLSITAFDDWYEVGVTPLHCDQVPEQSMSSLSANLTTVGRFALIVHALVVETPYDLVDSWDDFDIHTRTIAMSSQVDPKFVVPQGWRTELDQGDLVVFDPSYLHMGMTLQGPRKSVAAFFRREPLS